LSILVLAPYSFIPFSNAGGKVLNYNISKYLNIIDKTFVYSTEDNNLCHSNDFEMLFYIKSNKTRYIPFNYTLKLMSIIKKHDISKVICIQPYMALSCALACFLTGKRMGILSHNIESMRFKDFGKIWWPFLFLFEMLAYHLSHSVFFMTKEDINWANTYYKLSKNKSFFTPFGTEFQSIPQLKSDTKTIIAEKYGLNKDSKWIYFIGSMGYEPNYDAVLNINHFLATKLKKENQQIQLIIIGGGLSQSIQSQLSVNSSHIKYLGFVDNIEEIIFHAHIMLNPTLTGGGIKTKAVEALAYNKSVISFTNSAFGLDKDIIKEKLLISSDNDWNSLYENLVNYSTIENDISQEFYDTYYWGNVTKKIYKLL
jgi:glycosyltransferase involved in cell wall biosynthesis